MKKGTRRASVYRCGGSIWEEVRKNKEMRVALFQIRRNGALTVFWQVQMEVMIGPNLRVGDILWKRLKSMAVSHSYYSVIHLLYTILITDKHVRIKGHPVIWRQNIMVTLLISWLLVPSILLMKAIILVILVRLTNRSTTGMVMNKKVRPGRIQKWQR